MNYTSRNNLYRPFSFVLLVLREKPYKKYSNRNKSCISIAVLSCLKPQNLSILSFMFSRRKTIQMQGVWQSLQSVLQPDHPQQKTHRLQTLRLPQLRESIPEESGSKKTRREPTRGRTPEPGRGK